MGDRSELYLDDRQLLAQLDELVRVMPQGEDLLRNIQENFEWVGRARTLIAAWQKTDGARFAGYTDALFARTRDAHGSRLESLSALAKMKGMIEQARAELALLTGRIASVAVDAGKPFEFYNQVRRMIETAQTDILFVDRWMGADFVEEYLPHVKAGTLIRLLSRERMAPLKASVGKFVQQHQFAVEIRSSDAIHGRFLLLDGKRAFVADASFKDAARTAPAILIELTDLASTAIPQYEGIWQNATVERPP
jgi:hypothetical protein